MPRKRTKHKQKGGESRKITVMVQGKTVEFETDLTDREAMYRFKELFEAKRIGSSFAQSIDAHLRSGKTPSEKQMAWIHKMVVDAAPRRAPPLPAQPAPVAPRPSTASPPHTTETKYKVKVQGELVEFVSSISNEEALAKLRKFVEENKFRAHNKEFAQSLVNNPKLSATQWAWVHKLVLDKIATKKRTPSPTSMSIGKLMNPLTKRMIMASHENAAKIAESMLITKIPADWREYMKHLEKKGVVLPYVYPPFSKEWEKDYDIYVGKFNVTLYYHKTFKHQVEERYFIKGTEENVKKYLHDINSKIAPYSNTPSVRKIYENGSEVGYSFYLSHYEGT